MTQIRALSPKQRRVLTWWTPGSEDACRDAILCYGSVRSGKTLCMGLSFVLWAMACFRDRAFGLCGRTEGSLRRNLLPELLPQLAALGFSWEEKVSRSLLRVRLGEIQNDFYLFGGRDESSASLIQGVTLAGVLLDEAALMPRSFVEQALARCSVTGSRLWFNCNPEGPGHWLYREWVCKAEEKNALILHFTMEDNPALDPAVKARYQRLYTGVFYRRFVQGQWVQAQGLVYDFFDDSYIGRAPEGCRRWRVSCDYGTANPCSMGLWGEKDGVWYRVKEFYHDSRKMGRQKTDGEYLRDLYGLLDGRRPELILVDPSAASFIQLLLREGLPVEKADNEVLGGIRAAADRLRRRELVICAPCEDALREFSLYRWDDREGGRDAPRKENDHAMDDIRYFAARLAAEEQRGAYALHVRRSTHI